MGERYSADDIAFIRNNYLTRPYKEIAEHLGRTLRAIEVYISNNLTSKVKSFSIKEAQYIQNNYLHQTDKQIARILNRNWRAIQNYRANHQLIKPLPVKKDPIPKPKSLDLIPSLLDPTLNRVKLSTGLKIQPGAPLYRWWVILPTGEKKLEHYLRWEAQNGELPQHTFLMCLSDDVLNTHPDNWLPVTRSEFFRINAAKGDNVKRCNKIQESIKDLWKRVKIMEANGLPPRTKYRSKQKMCNAVPATPVIRSINTTALFDFA